MKIYTSYFLLPVEQLAADLKNSLGIREEVSVIIQRLGSDSIAALLKRISLSNELEAGYIDGHGRFDESRITSDISYPTVNSELTAKGLTLTQNKFRVIFTHDVDWVTPLEPTSFIKAALSSLKSEPYWLSLKDVVKPHLYRDTIDRMLAIENESGISATYFMMSGPHGYGRNDTRYDIKGSAARSIVKRILNAGGSIGLHGSYNAKENNSYGEEKKRIEDATACTILSHRNHYLRFSPTLLPGQLEEAGIKYDFSVGFTSRPGFRSYTTTAYKMINLTNQSVSNVTQIPLLAMDRLSYLQQGESFFDKLEILLGEVKKFNGCVSILTHPENFPFLPQFWDFYKRIIGITIKLGADISGTYPAA